MKTHELKTWRLPFQAMWDGLKAFELRRDDRGFAVGDLLRLREWNDSTMEYTGREIAAYVLWILDDAPADWGLKQGFCIMALAEMRRMTLTDEPVEVFGPWVVSCPWCGAPPRTTREKITHACCARPTFVPVAKVPTEEPGVLDVLEGRWSRVPDRL